LFQIVVDKDDMFAGFDRIVALGGSPDSVLPGHDPLVRARYLLFGTTGFVWRIA